MSIHPDPLADLSEEPTIPVPVLPSWEDPPTSRFEPIAPAAVSPSAPIPARHEPRRARRRPRPPLASAEIGVPTRPAGIPTPGSATGEQRAGRGLRTAVVVLAAAVAATAGGVLAAQAGVLRVGRATASAASQPALLTQVSSGNGASAYRISPGSYGITVQDSSRPCWVSITSDGRVVYAGVLAPGASAHATARRTITINLGAGGATVTVSRAANSQDLQPASAPYRLDITAVG